MHRAFSFPMTAERGRNKERLEASLAGLCELELLRQRQECLVLGALSLGDTGPALGDLLPPLKVPAGLSRLPDDLTLRRQLNGLHSAPWGLMATLAQLMGELRADLEPQVIMGHSRPNSGLYELSEGWSPGGGTDLAPPVLRDPTPTCVREARGTSAGERPRSISDIFVAKREGALDPRPAVPRSLSAPYEGGPWGPGPEVGPTVEDFREALRVEGYILGLLQRRTPRRPRTTSGPESRSLSRQSSLRRPNLQTEILTTSSTFPPGHPNPQPETLTPSPSFHLGYLNPHPEILTTSLTRPHQSSPNSAVRPSVSEPPCNSESNYSSNFLPNYLPESPQHTSLLLASPDQLVSAQYIPPSRQPPTSATPSQTPCAPERSPPIGRSQAPPRKGRSSEVDGSAPRRTGRREGRSQSENSLLGQQRGCGDRKCSTVERDGGRGLRDRHRRVPPPGILGDRRWRSSQELCQDEGLGRGEHGSQRPSRKPRPPPPPYPYGHGEEAGLDFGVPATGESDSSISEGDSPGPSSLSTDSDDSGGLVWPQQLPPQLAPLPDGPARQNAFVKIKASHALKKKILRFRTGSLKVMTTV